MDPRWSAAALCHWLGPHAFLCPRILDCLRPPRKFLHLEVCGSGRPLPPLAYKPPLLLRDLQRHARRVHPCILPNQPGLHVACMGGHGGDVLDTDLALQTFAQKHTEKPVVVLRRKLFAGRLELPGSCSVSSEEIHALALEPAGTRLVAAQRHRLVAWEAVTGAILWHTGTSVEHADHRGPSYCSVAVNRNGVLAVGLSDETVHLVSLNTGVMFRRLASCTAVTVSSMGGSVRPVAIGSDHVAGAVDRGRLVVWGMFGASRPAQLATRTHPHALCFTGRTTLASLQFHPHLVDLWDVVASERVRTILLAPCLGSSNYYLTDRYVAVVAREQVELHALRGEKTTCKLIPVEQNRICNACLGDGALVLVEATAAAHVLDVAKGTWRTCVRAPLPLYGKPVSADYFAGINMLILRVWNSVYCYPLCPCP